MSQKTNKKFFEWTWLFPFFFIAIIIGGAMTGNQKLSDEEIKRYHQACRHWVTHPANYQLCLQEKQEANLKKETHHSHDLLNADNEK